MCPLDIIASFYIICADYFLPFDRVPVRCVKLSGKGIYAEKIHNRRICARSDRQPAALGIIVKCINERIQCVKSYTLRRYNLRRLYLLTFVSLITR